LLDIPTTLSVSTLSPRFKRQMPINELIRMINPLLPSQ
jgi:hypothetical protein